MRPSERAWLLLHPTEARRERWLVELARDSTRDRWTPDESYCAVDSDVKFALQAGTLKKSASETLGADGRLAAHPAVRQTVTHLKRLRDEAWKHEPAFLKRKLRKRYHTFIRLMRLQRDPTQRHHLASFRSVLDYFYKFYETEQRVAYSARSKAAVQSAPAQLRLPIDPDSAPADAARARPKSSRRRPNVWHKFRELDERIARLEACVERNPSDPDTRQSSPNSSLQRSRDWMIVLLLLAVGLTARARSR
jgi:hypothetical protein